jgi:hypothetical protein
MSQVVAFRRSDARRTFKRLTRKQIVAQIIEALDALGGSAHRDEVVNQIAIDRRLEDANEIAELREAVYKVFHAHCETQDKTPQTPLFRRVFGRDSLRWGFSLSCEQALRDGEFDLEAMTG